MICIGIDPGVHTGFAVWDSARGAFLRVETLSLHAALFAVDLFAGTRPTQVVFEDARQRRWYGTRNAREDRAKLQGAGSIKRDCQVWEDFLTDRGIPFKAVPPRAGATKWDAEQFAKLTGWTGRTSNHARDAALLVYGQ